MIVFEDSIDTDLTCQNVTLTDTVGPQPENPICAVCSAGIVAGGFMNDAVFMDIDAQYIGQITAAKLITDTTNVRFRGDVIDRLNDPGTDITVGRFDGDATWAMLEFTLVDGTTQTNTIPVYDL